LRYTEDVKKTPAKNAAAVALGKRRAELMTPEERQALAASGGLVGGNARARALTKAQRKEIAAKAATARWQKATKGKK
jgi:hypothetical protein